MEKINIAEILEDCPKGIELYSPIFGKVYLDKIRPHLAIVVTTDKEQGNFKEEFLYDGRYGINGECMLFPSKGESTWEGFKISFKNGDVISNGEFIAFFCKFEDGHMYYHCWYNPKNLTKFKAKIDFGIGYIKEYRYATEEEKQKLFDAIKENGYKWNPETKTLEKVAKPNLNVGDRIRHKASSKISIILDIVDGLYIIGNGNVTESSIPFSVADSDYELTQKFDISTLIPFESRVLVRDFNEEKWCPAIWGIYNNDHEYPYTVEGGNQFLQCVPYDGNEHLLDTTDKCDEFYKTW